VFDPLDTVHIRQPEFADLNAFAHSVILHSVAFGKDSIVVGRKRRAGTDAGIDKHFGRGHTETKMQLSGNSRIPETSPATLVDLRRGDAGILDRIDLPTDDARRLMELGFLPGTRVTAGLSAPGGDPRVFQVDGSEIALRRETAKRLTVRIDPSPKTRH
jgi:ferrous iron transport protein A